MTEVKEIMVSKDTVITMYTNGAITITNSMLPNGSATTSSKSKARECLSQIMSLGDSVPIGCLSKLS